MNSKNFADKLMIFLEKYNTYNHRDRLLVHFGLETLYILITKLFIITILSMILGMTKEMYIFIFFYGILRLYASGLHLSSSFGCTVFSAIVLLGLPQLAMHTHILFEYRILLAGIVIAIFALYSPADTAKKPLIREEKRKKYKIISSFICYIYLFLILIIKDEFILNCITYSLLLQAVIILPITYKLFKQPYNNYINYKALL